MKYVTMNKITHDSDHIEHVPSTTYDYKSFTIFFKFTLAKKQYHSSVLMTGTQHQ